MQQLSLCRVEYVKLLPLHGYIVDIFSYSGPSGILGCEGEQNTDYIVGSLFQKDSFFQIFFMF